MLKRTQLTSIQSIYHSYLSISNFSGKIESEYSTLQARSNLWEYLGTKIPSQMFFNITGETIKIGFRLFPSVHLFPSAHLKRLCLIVLLRQRKELHTSSWKCMQAYECMHSGSFWNILEHSACIPEHSGTFCLHSACILEHSGTFCLHSETFLIILHAFW